MSTKSRTEADRPESLKMPIQGGILEALGINMYSTLGKCLVEFVSNAYDSDATRVNLTIPFDEIDRTRREMREQAKKEVATGQRDPFKALLAPLPEEVQVTIEDDGHGMTWEEVRDRFLPLNRKRRANSRGDEVNNRSESRSRHVIGRKGLGKLAGFGAAERVSVTTKRRGDSYATTIVMDGDVLRNADNLESVNIPVSYDEPADEHAHGTTVVLSGLKADAVRQQKGALTNSIAEAFYGIRPEEFEVRVNGDLVASNDSEFVVVYPEQGHDSQGFANHTFEVEDVGEVDIRYFVGFRAKSLPARKRGARIYCNNRLAAGPSLFNLPTGMHSFHSTDYMECVVQADQLDRKSVDFINTSRTQLREDTEIVRKLLDEVSTLMRNAIPAHARYRKDEADRALDADPTGRTLKKIVETLPKKTRSSANRLLSTLAAEFGVDSEPFQELAPVVTASMNATEVIINLSELKTNPETIAQVAEQLRELAAIERSDALKLYRARRNGIQALQVLWERSEAEWRQHGIEKELHRLVKQNPWLIRPELSTYLTSDQRLSTVVSKAAEVLKVDDFAPLSDSKAESDLRPDLVFLMSDPSDTGPFVMHVVELKSPTVPLTIDHHRQLEDYLFTLKQWAESALEPGHKVAIQGFLIGTMPKPDASSLQERQLRDAFTSAGPSDEIRIISLAELVRNAFAVHAEAIRALEKEESTPEAEAA